MGPKGGWIRGETSGQLQCFPFLGHQIVVSVVKAQWVEVRCEPLGPQHTEVRRALAEPHASPVQLRIAQQGCSDPGVFGRVGVVGELNTSRGEWGAGIGLGGCLGAPGPDRQHGHGVYTQNGGTVYAKAVIDDNPIKDITRFHAPCGGPVNEEFNSLGANNWMILRGARNYDAAKETVLEFMLNLEKQDGVFANSPAFSLP